MVFSFAACAKDEAPQKGEEKLNEEASIDHPVVLADHLVDIGTITEFDEEAALDILKKRYLGEGGRSCVVTQVDGNNLIGRNIDLSLSENTAFKFVLDINEYKAIGIAYSPFMGGFKFEDVVANGLPEEVRGVLPFTATDYFNEAGLYIETNMRNTEEGYINHGTNPESDIMIFSASIPAYVTTRCKTVDEVLALVEQFNVYTAAPPRPGISASPLPTPKAITVCLRSPRTRSASSPARTDRQTTMWFPNLRQTQRICPTTGSPLIPWLWIAPQRL